MAGAAIACLEKCDNKQCVSFVEKITAIIVFFALVFFIGQQFLQHDLQSGIFFVIAAAIVVLAIFAHKLGKISNGGSLFKPLSFVATISYPLYLLHQNIGYIIIRALDSNGLSNEWFLIIPIGVVIVLTYILHKLIEKPISKLSNTLCRRI